MSDPATTLASRSIAGVVAARPPWLPGYGLVIEVAADRGGSLGPLKEIRRQLDQRAPLGQLASRRLRGGLRRRLLGEPDADPTEAIVSDINLAASALEKSVLLVLDGAEDADAETVTALIRAASLPGWLRVAVLLVFHRVPAEGPPAELAKVLGIEAPAASEVAEAPEQPAIEEAPQVRPVPSDPGVHVTLRACALLGPAFAIADVARMQGISEVTVLERLQMAAEAGFPLTDMGDGRLVMPPPVAEHLRLGLLPSLRAAWGARVQASPPEGPIPGLAEQPDRSGSPEPREAPQPVIREALPPAPERRAQPEYGATPERTSTPPRKAQPEPQPAAQLAQLAVAAHRALDAGDLAVARQLCARALAGLDRLEPAPEHRRLGIELLSILAAAAQRGAGEHATLADALALAERARARLAPDDPPTLVAGILALLAGIYHDLGDEVSLNRALELLDEAMRSLQAAGDPLGAARLLNDQAAIRVRLGDPAGASRLLRASRQVFAARTDDPVSRRELAETDHLLARLPLHLDGLDPAAFQAALQSARSAGDTLRELGLPHELARVLETEGRLTLASGDAEGALALLQQAAELQQRLGDALGLAMTAAALADALGALQRDGESTALLADSIALNTRAGSPRGLAYNRRTLDRLAASPERADAEALAALREQITEAEQLLGRARL